MITKYVVNRKDKNKFAVTKIIKLLRGGRILSEEIITVFNTLKAAVEECEVLNSEIEERQINLMRKRYQELKWLSFMEMEH